jgi:hypothetical protein
MSALSIHAIIWSSQQDEADKSRWLASKCHSGMSGVIEGNGGKEVRRTVRKVQRSRLAGSKAEQSESGQASIEFALTITLTLLLIFALIDFSRAIYTASVIQWAAQSGARAAIIELSQNASETAVQNAVEAAVKERLVGLDEDEVVLPPINRTGNVVEVEVTYEFRFLVPIVSQITGESFEISSSASMIAY